MPCCVLPAAVEVAVVAEGRVWLAAAPPEPRFPTEAPTLADVTGFPDDAWALTAWFIELIPAVGWDELPWPELS